MIPDETVERVREAADIVAIVGEYVKLKRAGSSFRGPCPFHQGKNDNFSVNPRGGYNCFVCGEKGDVFTFIRKHLGLDFVGAVKLVGEKSGIQVEEVASRRAEPDPREPFWEINASADAFFQNHLLDPVGGKIAREYLESRKITLDDAKRFGIGFAPRSDLLSRHLTALGFSEERQIAAGLLLIPEGKPTPLVRFRNRLIFPIADAAGHVVGFGGRLLGPGEPKYLNSPDSELFSKRKLLYGMHWAKTAIRKTDRVFVVEGYFDVIRLVLAGFEEVVAPMGTALTAEQADSLKRLTHRAYLLYDSDGPGLRATFKSGDVLLAAGLAPQVVTLAEGEDPDTYTAKYGPRGLNNEISKSIDIFDRKIQILERAGFFSDIRRRREAVDKLLPTIRLTVDPITQALYIARAAEVCGLAPETLERELTEPPKHAAPKAPETKASGPRLHRGRKYPPEGFLKERATLRTAFHRRDLAHTLGRKVGPEHFRDPIHKKLYNVLMESPEASIDELAAGLSELEIEVLQELCTGGKGLSHEVTLLTGINALLEREQYGEGEKLQERLVLVGEKINWLNKKLSKVDDRIRERWATAGNNPSTEDERAIDVLSMEQSSVLDERSKQSIELRKLKVHRYRMFPYPQDREISEGQGRETGFEEDQDRGWGRHRRAVGGSE